jgi:hypothetical protein
LNGTQEQLHLSQVIIKKAVEQIYKEMLASGLIPHPRKIPPMRAESLPNWRLRIERFPRRMRPLGRKRKRKKKRATREEEENEEQTVLNDDMEHSVIAVAPRC